MKETVKKLAFIFELCFTGRPLTRKARFADWSLAVNFEMVAYGLKE
jgi:hypothetical protein